MANETSREQIERVTSEELLESVDIVTEYLHEELRECEEGEETPDDRIAFHVRRLTRWRNQPPEIERPKTFNGWKNYETWLANLWLTNEGFTYDYWREQTREAFRQFPAEGEGVFTQREAGAFALARQMKEEIEPESAPYCSLSGDLFNSAFGEIDWYEVALSFLDEQSE